MLSVFVPAETSLKKAVSADLAALPEGAVWFGEISLAGEVRPVAHSAIRQREAAKLGNEEAAKRIAQLSRGH